MPRWAPDAYTAGAGPWPWFGLAALAVLAMIAGSMRIALRLRWLRRVAAGEVEGFFVTDAQAEVNDLPALVPSRWAAGRVLVRLPSPTGPYRAEQALPLGGC